MAMLAIETVVVEKSAAVKGAGFVDEDEATLLSEDD